LSSAAIELGLVDELRIFRNPVVVGGGRPFLPPVTEEVPPNLIETRTSAAAPILGRRIEEMPDRPAGIETEAIRVTGDYGTGVRPRANTVEYRIGMR